MKFITFRFFLLAISGGCALWFAGSSCLDLWTYSRLDVRYPAKIFKWEIERKSASQFVLIAHFIYEVRGETYQGKTRLKKPYYLNEASAEAKVKEFETKCWAVWVDASFPQFSSLERSFPLKNVLYGVICLGILVYFACSFTRNMETDNS
jgi:hypothetical protein